MPPWEESFRALSAVAARQQGLFTSGQAGRAGVDGAALARFRRAGLLLELDWEVYQVASSPLGPAYAYPYAAWLAISPDRYSWERPQDPTDDAVLSHESACELHGMGSGAAPTLVFTASMERLVPRATRIHHSRLSPSEVMVVTGVPVTTPHRTLLDLVRDWAGHEEIGRALFDAARRDLVDLNALYRDMVPLAAEHRFPVGGNDFIQHFIPDLPPASLPLRNLRAYAALSLPGPVAEVSHHVRDAVTAAHLASGSGSTAEPTPEDEVLIGDLAAEIVGRIWTRPRA